MIDAKLMMENLFALEKDARECDESWLMLMYLFSSSDHLQKRPSSTQNYLIVRQSTDVAGVLRLISSLIDFYQETRPALEVKVPLWLSSTIENIQSFTSSSIFFVPRRALESVTRNKKNQKALKI